MRSFPLLLMLFLAQLLCPSGIMATHVVGGEVKYDALGNDSYYVHLTLYIDCYNGLETAIALDSTAYIGVFDGLTRELVRLDTVYRTPPKRLSKSHYRCVVPPGDVCVDMYTYDTVMHLPPNDFGYNIVYQRCCRNHSIVNLEDPGGQGATYSAFIPGVKRYGTNSNARFKERPPNYLCINEELVFDHSATDPDGDSLVYRICTPYTGGTRGDPKPNPGSPPHRGVQWLHPYSDTLPLSVKKGFNIHPHTGKLRFIPNRLGQYVFGVCVDEYRDGQWLGHSIRDYQFNVMHCEFLVNASFDIPDFSCLEEIEISVTSNDANTFHWDFGLQGRDDDTSNLTRPSFTYPGPGEYLVTLAFANGRCADTVSQWVSILDRGPRNVMDHSKCPNDTLELISTGFYGVKGEWEGDFITSTSDSTALVWNKRSGSYVLRYDTAGCTIYDSHYVQTSLQEPILQVDSSSHCLGMDFMITVSNADAFEEVVWQKSSWQFDTAVTYQLVVPFNESDEVGLLVKDTGTHCLDSFNYEFKAPENPGFSIETYNIITPNYDGSNECFKVLINGQEMACQHYSLLIYNRWGELVYEHDGHEQPACWDGTNYKNGKLVPASTYFYILEVDGFERYGTVTVVR